MQRVLITGAAGFIGSHACEAFAQAGYDTVGIDNFDPYYDRRIKQTNVAAIEAAGAQFREADIRDAEGTASLFDVTKPDVIVHLAAKAGVRNSEKFPAEYVQTNVNGTQSVLDAARRNDVERVVMASTSSVYGSASSIPFAEDDPAAAPLQPYAASKRAAEILAGTYCSLYGLQVTVTRLFTVYGPRGRPDMMPYMLARSCRDGSPVPLFEGPLERDWTYVGDIVDGLVQAAENPLGFEILNLGRGEPVALAEFIDEMAAAAGTAPVLEPRARPATELLTTFADSSKARERIGFDPTVSVHEGVARFWDWFAAQS
jgi:UDP-glucuronate 4-epimerase